MEEEALALVRRIAGYSTTEEILDTVDNEDERRELEEEDMSASADELNKLIMDARKIVGVQA